MINAFCNCFQSVADAASPWLKCVAALCFLAWLAMLLWEYGAASEDVAKFKALSPFKKLSVVAVLCMFTLLGGTKEGGDRGGVSGGLRISSSDSQHLRTSPPALEATSNLLAITAFEVLHSNCTVSFETSWATNLFDYTDSRNLYLFSSTNLIERKWTPLCMIPMPENTNVHSFVVAQSDVMLSMRPWFLDSFGSAGFYRFGVDFDSDGDGIADDVERLWTLTDPAKVDTDGDGLSDGQELSYQVNTNPLAYDTDCDGVGDGDEIAAGSNPHRENSDQDELTDAQELGTMTALTEDNFMWFDMSEGTDLLAGYSTVNSSSWVMPLASETVVNNVCYTNVRVCVDGTAYLLCPTNVMTGGYSSYNNNLSNVQWSASHLTVALCGANLYARTSDWGSKILYGSLVSEGRYFDVVEYRNMGLYDHNDTNELITCQLILPHDETNTIYVSYLCASNTFRDVSFAAGIQCGWIPSNKSGERFYNLSWPIVGDFPQDGLTIKYSIGACTDPTKTDTDDDGLSDSDETLLYNTNPLVADTDGDGIPDGIEVSLGSDPNSVDTDEDGMPDGWEVYYELNPLVDDSALDLDNDGLVNLREYALGTSPVSVDTDDDGLTDRAEVGWWEYANSMPVFDVSGGTNLLQASRAYYSDTFKVSLPFTVRSAGYMHTNITVGVCGMVGLMSDRKSNYSFSVSSSNHDFSNYLASYYHTAVAAYWDYLCSPANSGAQITVADIETNSLRYAVVEYSNIRLYSQMNDASYVATFQIIIPEAETNTVYVHYIDLADAFDGSSATVGAQLPNREQTHLVSFDTVGAVTNGMIIAYHFGTGSNPGVADTDGDGLDDGTEAAIGTSARYADTDLDGLTDAWENANGLDPLSATDGNGADGDPDGDHISNEKEFEYGTDPSVADTDGDGLSDGLETGSVFATNAIPWLSFDVSEDLTTGISTNYRRCVNRPTPVPLRIQGEIVTNLTISANGLVFLDRAGHANSGNSTSGSNFKYTIDEDALVLAPYLQYANIRSDVEGRCTSIKFGTATCGGVGYLLVEYLNSYYDTSTWQTNSISFQLAIPTNATDRAYSRYSDVFGQYMDGRNASIGLQTFNGRWLHSWCYHSEGRVADGLALEFLFGANSDPLAADTDGDGLNDGQEVMIGTSPAKADTDGDSLPDGWEVQYGLNPLSADGNDGDAGDPDGDCVDNQNEYEFGTDPNLPDTDGDGLSDGKEVVCASFANPLPWLEVSVLTNMTEAITNAYGCVVSWDLPSPILVQRETVSNITINTRGVVCLNRAGYSHPNDSHSPYNLQTETVDTNAFVVSAYGGYLNLYDVDKASSVKIGAAECDGRGYIVVEYDNMYKERQSSTTNAISFQVAIPTGRVDRICVNYADMVGRYMDGRNAIIGCQSFGAEDRISYCRNEQGKIYDGMSMALVVGYGSNPLVADTDGDGILDGVEVNIYGSNPKSTDTDADGLPDAQEASLGTALNNPDSDGDGLLDDWEVANNFNPLSTPGNGESGVDTDGDGLTNLQEQAAGSNPRNADTDGDGLSDSAELTFGTNPTLADTDSDGLSDGEEQNIGTNPLMFDTDGDGMNDGWEQQHAGDGFDPTVNNATDNNPDNDLNADPDGDSLTNQQEAVAGTSPTNSDTDGDGLSDGVEVEQDSDPNDRADTIPVKWASVTGDLDQNVFKQVSETITIPAGTMAFIGVFLFSEEYPLYTGSASEFNDRAVWSIQAVGNASLEGLAYVNNEDGSWDAAGDNGYMANGFSPVILKDKAIYVAPGDSDLSVSVNIAAMNISDDNLPTTVLVGVFPLKVVQANMPIATGVANTTDAATSYFRAFIPTNGVSYITAAPTAPQLTAGFKGLPSWIKVSWSGSLTTERSERNDVDNRTLTPQTIAGDEIYDIANALNGETIGGRFALNVSTEGVSATYPFSIRGKNPLDATAFAYINSHVATDFQAYAWMIAKHESKSGSRLYNQFNPSGNKAELPNWGTPYGWGIAQIDKGLDGDTTAEVYDWHENIYSMNEKLQSALSDYNRFVGYYRNLYANDPSTHWSEPDDVTTTVDGYEVSAEMWSVLTFYNGAGGCPRRHLAGAWRLVPLEFDPVTTNWVLYANSQNYVNVTVSDRNQQGTE